MKINRYIIILFLFNIGLLLHGQEYETPKVIKTDVVPKVFGSEINYKLPDTVNQILTNYIGQFNDTSTTYYIEVAFKESNYELRLYNRQDCDFIDSTSLSEQLLSSTNRFCRIADKYIPIYFEVDRVFGSFNFTMTATTLVIKLNRKSYRQFEVSSVYVTN